MLVLIARKVQYFFLFAFVCVPILAFAYSSVVATFANQAIVLPIADVKKSQEFFGKLDNFPHIFEFEVREKQVYKAEVSVPDSSKQKNDVALIVVKAERRGVTEIGRTTAEKDTWTSEYNTMYAESLRKGGKLEGTLEKGWYKIEVSSPNNIGAYRLVWGTGKISRGYFANVQALFEVKGLLGHSKFGVLRSPLIYIPLLILLLCGGFFWYRKRKIV